jgi:hypothetical protein
MNLRKKEVKKVEMVAYHQAKIIVMYWKDK